ncbi:hypothetical protein ATX64_04975 [Oenococcus oeni]|nr:hypothetical protein ATX64_04975 [Oenococcus oeni]
MIDSILVGLQIPNILPVVIHIVIHRNSSNMLMHKSKNVKKPAFLRKITGIFNYFLKLSRL